MTTGLPAVDVRSVTKHFRLYHEKNTTLKAAVLRGGRARYENFLALDDVSFSVPVGSTFGLIGENGSGKSTLLKCMARILRPDSGEIVTRGKVSALLELGAGFHGELSGRENIYLNGSILGLSRRELDARFDDIVGFAGGEVPRFIDNPVKNYSSGMFVRLGFAIAINVEPEVLLVDEILAVGDEDFQRKCMAKFAEMRKAGRTVVVVSHSLDTVRSLCDHAAWLEHGQLRELGRAGKVVEAYLDAVTDQRHRIAASAPGEPGPGPRPAAPARPRGLIESVELLDPKGRATTVVRTGEPATVRVRLRCGTTGGREVLRLEVSAADGTLVSRVSTRDTTLVLDELEGVHIVDYLIPKVLLGTREYDLSLAVLGEHGQGEIERLPDVMRFEVAHGEVRHKGGVMMLGGDFRAEPAS